MTARRHHQIIITVRANRRGVVVERAGAAPWVFPADEATEAVEFAKVAARLFGARLIIDLDREAAP